MNPAIRKREKSTLKWVLFLLGLSILFLFVLSAFAGCGKRPIFEASKQVALSQGKKKDSALSIQQSPIVLDSNFEILNLPVIWLCFHGDTTDGNFGHIESDSSHMTADQEREVIDSVRNFFKGLPCVVTANRNVYQYAKRRMKVVITQTYEWIYNFFSGGASGIAVTGAYASYNPTPAYVFTADHSLPAKYIAFFCAHEIGHLLGLMHQVKWSDQCSGWQFNTGDGHKSPFMSQVTDEHWSWWDGTCEAGCSSDQNDIAQILKSLLS